MTVANVWTYFCFSRSLIVEVFHNYALVKRCMATWDKVAICAKAVNELLYHPPNVWVAKHGSRLTLVQGTQENIQLKYYNGWTHNQYFTGCFIFCPDAVNPTAFYNVRWSVHLTSDKCTVNSAIHTEMTTTSSSSPPRGLQWRAPGLRIYSIYEFKNRWHQCDKLLDGVCMQSSLT